MMTHRFSRNVTRMLRAGLCATLLCAASAVPALAQGLFSPAIQVNDQVITNYEINQRALMLQLLRAPGEPRATARKQLIEDRLKVDAARRAGISVTREDIQGGMAEFAARANLSAEEFVREIGKAGVEVETFRDFVQAGLMWRELLRARYAGRVQISDAEVDRALSSRAGGSSVRVLLSEIIMPAPPREAARVNARAAEISQYTTEAAFSAAARKYSATPSRGRGGKLPWQKLDDLPPPLRPLVLALGPGEVTDPLPIPNAVALFQLRAIEETAYSPPSYSAIEYAAYYMAGGRSEQTLAQANRIKARVDTCDDLYGVAKGQPEEVLDRDALPPDEIPTDIALELAKLDPGEVSTTLTRANGQTLVFLMLCGRSPVVEEEQPDRQAIVTSLRNRRLETLSNSFLEELRADARIVVYE